MQALATVDALHPVQGLVVLPTTDQGVGQKAGAGGAPRDRQLHGVGHQDLCAAQDLLLRSGRLLVLRRSLVDLGYGISPSSLYR